PRVTLAARLTLLVVTAAATIGLLLVAPTATADTTVPILAVSVAGLGALIVLEERRPRLPMPAVFACSGVLVAVAVARPPHGSDDVWSYVTSGRMLTAHHAKPSMPPPIERPRARFPR